ncbi:hypothetical protein [Brevibacillus centrosporus]|uniref:Bacteriophage lambda head decoration protein D n=1 Tax=Brevibacillus centrosporus TaxID=54910 RepID=A0A1I3M0R6_9BACL|nr:hypothetical protein [Brevibacillus centrosporus]SFI90325.1 hypothetical protein SAMN05518846_101479 [Brevibacillus centrosporus]
MLTQDRNTKQMATADRLILPIAANTVIYQGGLVAINAAGEAVPAAATAGLKVAGRAEAHVDNRYSGTGENSIAVGRGIFLYRNSTANPVTAAQLLEDCFVEDDETVRVSTAGTNIRAGKVISLDAKGVWVEIR